MTLRRPVFLLLFVLFFVSSLAHAASDVVISQVYGGGGNSGAPYKNDFIELFNRGASTVNLAGWSVQYASSSGSSWQVTPLSGSIAPGRYYLVQEAAGSGAVPALPTPDATGSIAMSATAGKVALVSSTTALTGTCPTGVVDFAGFGGANCFEGAGPTATLSNSTAALRASDGCTDNDSNSSDFATGAPAPRNSGIPAHLCGAPPVQNDPPSLTGFANPVATVDQDAAPFTVSFSGSDDKGTFNWSAVAGTGVSSVAVASGQGTANASFTVTLQPGFNGTATFTVRLSDNVNPAASAAATITVNAPPPPPIDHIVISQIYGGGGNSGATYRNDFVELFNPTTDPVDLGGWSVQYASASGTSWQVQLIGGIMQPGEYYLVALASGGAAGTALPEANVNGSLNLSGTTGKVALSKSLDPLDGCPVSDPNLVDLVGFGSANCREGLTNAPAPSNTTALFRKSGGLQDTNVNGADFATGAPSPRRTTAIQEIGPAIASTDPRSNGFNAPRDASITVGFTEPVTVSGAWFEISCASSGRHDDATVASLGYSLIITPNRNFDAGEQCSVTIFRLFVSDADLDDAGPNDDHLRSDYTFSFTVASGAAPAYPSDVHVAFGNPSNATADLTHPDNYLMVKPEFVLSYNRDRGTPNWVSWHLADEWVGTLTRFDTFRPDPAVPAEWYRVLHTDYSGSGFDRGHMTPNADRDKETSVPINQATFLMTNMVPQAPDNNQGPWADLENYLRSLLPANELYIVAGGAGDGGTGSNGPATTIADGHVSVPAYTWKVALVLPKASGDDVARVTAATRSIAVILPNVQGIRNTDWTTYLTTIDAVEQLTGYDFFANLPDAIEKAVEAGTNGANPPAAEVVAPARSIEGSAVTASVIVSDNASGSSTSSWSVAKNGNAFASGTGTSVTFTPDDDGTYVITSTVTAADGPTATATASVAVSNAAPSITTATATAAPISLGTSATMSVTYTDAGPADTHVATFTWGDGSASTATCVSGVCSASHTYATTGVFTTSVAVTDDDGGSASTSTGNVVVYDANGGSITGGGWITTQSGKATFNLNTRYLKNATKPTGNTRIELAGATLVSTSHDWLVVAGTAAQLQGSGTIGGAGDYGFLVTATDNGASDTIRVRVWEKSSGTTVFDSGASQLVSGGNITIH